MSNLLINPITLYVTGITLVTVLIIIFTLSVYYYSKAKNIAPFLAQIEDLQRTIAEAQNTLEEIKKEFREKQDELAKADRLIADGNEARDWLDQNRTKVESLKFDIDKQGTKLKDATENYGKRQEELSELIQQIADKHVAIKTATELKNKLDIKISGLSEQSESLKASIKQETKHEKGLIAGIDQLRDKKNELDAKVKDLERQEKRLGEQLQEEKDEHKQLKKKITASNEILAQVEGKAQVAKSIIAEGQTITEMNEERWKDLDRKIFSDDTPITPTNVNEETWLETFSASLRKHGFMFDRRILYAFHTGLKCAEISPLVVLAGISGTGKSLLPELYSSALGMNFLPVAVQPRWDSPQDMFGFYNYMEGRYKATELSRLLWQFDKYNNPEAENIYQKEIPLNLILLDEMNLARVEYYFSDMLSKLEIRHGLNPADKANRQKAEIEIECNASAKNQQTRRLFVALNTLFIGTMNEDESTQTLSAKVIDRSNVIRFGQPKQLASVPDKEGFLERWTGKDRITFQNWTDWRSRKLDSQNRKELDETLTKINTALSVVERPFGHRVSQAIEKYVTYYPGKFTEALADQIEMKILPKLSGLDSQVQGFDDVMRVIENRIEQVGDDDLKKAFGESRKSADDSFFRWRGVMR
ncbi:MAG: AAA family ATPase [Deltaproteobacteria bacterium]|nr:AAA family ATPase [Deltaproteobacteria bacterium]MBW2661690.1 AAA family ATPase [Deltaproteobacteria bacterium]